MVQGVNDVVLRPMIFVSLGRGVPENDELWRSSRFIREVVRYQGAAPSGRRAGSRALGLGLDSALVALKVVAGRHRGPFLAVNPWVAVALRLVGKSDVRVTGVYAQKGSRSFQALRRLLGNSHVVTTVKVEAETWNSAGGNALEVLYGNTFRYPKYAPSASNTLRIFVGGSSDRDRRAIARLEAEVRSSPFPVSLLIASDEAPSAWTSGPVSIERSGRVSAAKFGEMVADSDVVYLPLINSGRAAGHMVTVGALESGVSVVTSSSGGMDGYVDEEFVTALEEEEAVLPQLQRAAEVTRLRHDEITEVWRTKFSLSAYIERVGEALTELELRDRIRS
jgi:hypothetical protein